MPILCNDFMPWSFGSEEVEQKLRREADDAAPQCCKCLEYDCDEYLPLRGKDGEPTGFMCGDCYDAEFEVAA